jgi:antitoxin VapB
MPKAKVFMSGGSQAVRLPAEFRFEAAEVYVRRDAISGDVILSKPQATWDEYFAWVTTLGLPGHSPAERYQPTDDFRDPFAGPPPPAPRRRAAAKPRRTVK